MKTFKNCAAQGDVLFRKMDNLPQNATKRSDTGSVIIAHSETGHHHVFEDPIAVSFYTTADPFLSYLEVKEPSVLKHLRDFDTHEEILFDAGIYELRRQREYTPEGYRMVVD